MPHLFPAVKRFLSSLAETSKRSVLMDLQRFPDQITGDHSCRGVSRAPRLYAGSWLALPSSRLQYGTSAARPTCRFLSAQTTIRSMMNGMAVCSRPPHVAGKAFGNYCCQACGGSSATATGSLHIIQLPDDLQGNVLFAWITFSGGAESNLSLHSAELICLDEIQRLPELLKQSGEFLAGRIACIHLPRFTPEEVPGSDSGASFRRLLGRLRCWLTGCVGAFVEVPCSRGCHVVPMAGAVRSNLPRPRHSCARNRGYPHRDGGEVGDVRVGVGVGVGRTAGQRQSGRGNRRFAPQTIGRYLDLLEATYMVRLLV